MSKIELINLQKQYGDTIVLQPLNCTIHKGQFTVILGPSGCGKSTLLRLISGLDEVSDGKILKDDKEIQTLSPVKRGCAMVFQSYALYPHMTIYDNINYGLKQSKLSKSERQKRIEDVVEMLRLEKVLERKPHEISGGQQQRVAIGRAIARRPDIFLFDEPLSNIDSKLRMDMRIQLRKLISSLNTTTLYVTHDQTEAMTLADRIIVMNDGTIEQVGTPNDIYFKPATTFVASFVGSPPVNLIPATVSDDLSKLILSDQDYFFLDQVIPQKYQGQEVLLGLRPEDIVTTSGHDGINVKINLIENLGASKLIHGSVGNTLIHISSSHLSPSLQVGEIVRVTAHQEKFHLFDTHTRSRITQ